ncbi:hypothetical protein ES705_40726 [subsurface metagenome]
MKKNSIKASIKYNISEQQSNFKEHISLRFYIVLIFWVFWALLQSLSMLQLLPSSYAQIFWYLKNLSGVLAIIVGSILYLKSLKLYSTAVFSLLFSCYAISNVMIKGCTLTNLYQPLMYFVWGWGLFVVAPIFLSSTRRIIIFLRYIFWGTTFILFVGEFWERTVGKNLTQSDWSNIMSNFRYVFGFRHPGYVATIIISIILMCWFLYSLSPNRFERIITLSVSILGIIALYLTASRSVLAFLMVVIILMVVKRLNIKSSGYVILSFVILFFFIIFFSDFLLHYPESFQKFDIIFSGRLNIWANAFRDTFSVNPYSILWGGKQAILRFTPVLSGIDGGSISFVFGRYRTDSVYMDILLMYGVIGLTLFIFIFLRLFQFSIRKQKTLSNTNSKNIYSLAIAVVVGTLVASFPASLIPSMGNLINAALLPVAVALLYIIKPDYK